MSEYDLRLAKPHCDACHKPKGVQESLNEISPMFNSYEPPEQSLADRLQQTIQQAQEQEDEI